MNNTKSPEPSIAKYWEERCKRAEALRDEYFTSLLWEETEHNETRKELEKALEKLDGIGDREW